MSPLCATAGDANDRLNSLLAVGAMWTRRAQFRTARNHNRVSIYQGSFDETVEGRCTYFISSAAVECQELSFNARHLIGVSKGDQPTLKLFTED